MRVTSIIGAGAPLDFNYEKAGIDVVPTTKNITDKVIEDYEVLDVTVNTCKTENSDLVKRIYEKLLGTYPSKNFNWKESEEKQDYVNFEMIFHVLESLNAYKGAWDGSCHNETIYPVFGPFTKQNISFKDCELMQIPCKYIMRIMDIVNSYNEYYEKEKNGEEKWYHDFFVNNNVLWDIFNLNYDTTIESSIIDYCDGFEDNVGENFKSFYPQALWNSEKTTINHLHGCINFFMESYNDINDHIFERDFHELFKYDNYKTVRDMMIGRGYSYPSNQTGETYYCGPIITGLRKTDKLSNIPFDFYRGHLCNSIIKNNSVIIIGYSFGDIYINNLLDRMNVIHGDTVRVVLIDYWNETKIKEQNFNHYCEYSVSGIEMSFILKISHVNHVGNLQNELQFKDINTPMYSNNGRLMLLVGGFKKATEYSNEIFEFINS